MTHLVSIVDDNGNIILVDLDAIISLKIVNDKLEVWTRGNNSDKPSYLINPKQFSKHIAYLSKGNCEVEKLFKEFV